MRIPLLLLPHTVTVQPYEGTGAYGDRHGPAVTVRAQVEDSRRLVRSPAGEELVSAAIVRTRLDVHAPPGSQLTVWPGTAHERMARVITADRFEHPGTPGHLELALT
ncbi:hypothetical protein AB0L13_11390 [Saccharopolyspora shandongensis]|uniref:hypothetical protein n=1 Tax=Saccharopolyspora shandongensis TaxID=418495 RepID=UPI003426ACA8